MGLARRILSPLVKRGITDPELAADLFNLGPQLRLLECKCNLLLGNPASLHNMTPSPLGEKSCRNFYFNWLGFLGQGHEH
jgi:hypothetical protein